MNIWGILGIVISIIGAIIGAVYKIDSYIDNQVEAQYQVKVSEFMLKKQNQAILDKEISTRLFKDNWQEKQVEIKKQVEYIKIKDDTCEAKLKAIQELINVVY